MSGTPIADHMGRLILAIVITIWGAGIVLRGLLGDGPSGSGAYAAGQLTGFVVGLVMVGAGLRLILRRISRG